MRVHSCRKAPIVAAKTKPASRLALGKQIKAQFGDGK